MAQKPQRFEHFPSFDAMDSAQAKALRAQASGKATNPAQRKASSRTSKTGFKAGHNGEKGVAFGDDSNAHTRTPSQPSAVQALSSGTALQEAAPMDAVRLIGAVSHEMRNPLNGILGMAHLLAETQLDGAQRNYLDGIATSGTVLLTLVNDLLDLTALQTGKVAMTKALSDVAQMINQTLELAAPRAHGKELSLGSFVDHALSEPFEIDAGRVQQILTNLVSNAIKFTDHGGVRLNASLVGSIDGTDPSANEPHQLVFDVIDTGHGIAPEDQALVFAPFGRTQSALNQGTEGTGLGLPLSRGLARAMGGELTLVQSARGRGTHMRLEIPLSQMPKVSQSDEAWIASKILEGEHVLIATCPVATGSQVASAISPETQALCDTLEHLGAQVRVLQEVAELNGPPQGIDHVLIDAQFDHAMLWARLCLPGTGVRPVILLKPDERGQLPHLRDAGFGGYLIRPVRQSSLVAMLTDRFGAKEEDVFLADPADASDGYDTGQTPALIQTILLADDNPVNALLARTALEKAGHHVTVVDDGARAIAAVIERKNDASANGKKLFDTVVLDLSMPVLDGFASARQMRAAGFEGRIVALSGNTDPDLESKLLSAGFNGFAQKPINPGTLQKLIGQPSH